MEVKNEISLDEMKKIAHEIIEEVSKKENVNINAFPITFGEYYNNIKEKSSNLVFIGNLFENVNAVAHANKNGEIFVFIDRIGAVRKIGNKLFNLVEICYHEARHIVQQNFNIYNYDGFFYRIDDCLQTMYYSFDYKMFHDNYSYEIGAHLYAVSNAKKYLIEKYPEIYDEYKDEIGQLEKKYIFDYLTYDASDTFERFIRRARKDPSIDDFKKYRLLKNVLDIFMDDINHFKDINQIIHDVNFERVDPEIVFAIFSSKAFLDSVDIEKLNNEELEVLHNALQYTNNVYQNQVNFIEKSYKEDVVTLKECLKKQQSLLKKLNTIYIIIKKNNRKLLSKEIIRKETTRLEHMDNIPVYLEKTNKLIKKKSNSGYSYVYMLFGVVGVISLFTIFYLVIIK